jgi:hypothetical protein
LLYCVELLVLCSTAWSYLYFALLRGVTYTLLYCVELLVICSTAWSYLYFALLRGVTYSLLYCVELLVLCSSALSYLYFAVLRVVTFTLIPNVTEILFKLQMFPSTLLTAFSRVLHLKGRDLFVPRLLCHLLKRRSVLCNRNGVLLCKQLLRLMTDFARLSEGLLVSPISGRQQLLNPSCLSIAAIAHR